MYLDHLERLHDTLETPDSGTLHYWWIYAAPAERIDDRPPTDIEYEPFPASNEGITCVDDVARIAVAYLTHYEIHGDSRSRERAKQALDFVLYMQCDDGTFLNFVTEPAMNEQVFGQSDPDVVDGVRVDGTMTSKPALEFWSSRACWALGEAYETFVDAEPSRCEKYEAAIQAHLDTLESGPLADYGEYDTQHEQEIPAWLPNGETYTAAPIALGLASYYRASGDDRAESALRQIADGIRDCGSGDMTTYPFGAHVAGTPGKPWHTWGLRQAAALARAGDALSDQEYVNAARGEVAALHTLHCSTDGQISDFGPSPLSYHQLSYGTDALVHGCTELWRATGERTWAALGAQLATWYHGSNVEQAVMWDADAGRGYDGVYQDTVDWKAGAESTVAAVRTMLDIERYPDGIGLDGPISAVDDHCHTVLDAAKGAMDRWATRYDPGTVEAVLVGGQVARVFEPGRMTLETQVEPGEYRPYVVVTRTIAPDSEVVIDIGGRHQTCQIGRASDSRFEMFTLDPVEISSDSEVSVTYRGARDRSAKVDAIVLSPAIAWRAAVTDGGTRVAGLARSVVDDRRSVSMDLPTTDSDPLSVRIVGESGTVVERHRVGKNVGDEDITDGSDSTGPAIIDDSDEGTTTVSVPVEPRGFTLVQTLSDTEKGDR